MSFNSFTLPFIILILLLSPAEAQDQPPTSDQVPAKTPAESTAAESGESFNEQFAFGWLEAICEIGPRMSTSTGMASQQKMLQKHFESLGAQVGYQNFNVRDPRTGGQAALSNLVVRFHPTADPATDALLPLRHASLSRSRSGESSRSLSRCE